MKFDDEDVPPVMLVFEVHGDPFGVKSGEGSAAECHVNFESVDPKTGQSAGFLETLACWQAITQLLIDSLEDMDDPQNLVGKLKHAQDVVFPDELYEDTGDEASEKFKN